MHFFSTRIPHSLSSSHRPSEDTFWWAVPASQPVGWLVISALLLLVTPTEAAAGEWPQVLGPARSGVAAADERLAQEWPAAGPATLWRRGIGAGYAGIAVAGERAFLFHRVNNSEVLEALDAASGKPLWTDGHPTTFAPQVGGGNGPLCVPVVDAGRVITFGAQGVLICRDAATGKKLWQRDTLREFAAQEGYFGVGSSPLVVDGKVLVNVGGTKQEAGLVAFDLATGATVWQKTAEPASYSSPIVASVGEGRTGVVAITRYACVLLDPATGAIGWQFPFGQRGPTVNGATPVLCDKGRLLVTASYGIGSVYGSFDAAGFKPIWDGNESLASQYCTPTYHRGYLYCVDGRDDVPPAVLKCVEAATGKVVWQERLNCYGTLILADEKLVLAKTDGELVLLSASAEKLSVLARARPLPATVRALPALSGGRLYLRNDDTLVAVDVGLVAAPPEKRN